MNNLIPIWFESKSCLKSYMDSSTYVRVDGPLQRMHYKSLNSIFTAWVDLDGRKTRTNFALLIEHLLFSIYSAGKFEFAAVVFFIRFRRSSSPPTHVSAGNRLNKVLL